jgi:hypothetical protein
MTNLNDIITNNRLKTFVKNNKTIKKEELQEKKNRRRWKLSL